MDISFEQRQAHVAQSVIDIFFGDFPLTTQSLEGQFEFFG
jgi:hypothetical protein